MVPQTNYQLNYGSVEAVGSYGVSFSYVVNGLPLYGGANCQQGLRALATGGWGKA